MGNSTVLACLAVATSVVAGCGADDSAICLSNDVAEVCATPRDGAIEFSGTGLAAGSDVWVDTPELGEAAYRVGDDGAFEPGGRGAMSVVADTEFTFSVSATDAAGQPLDGQIAVRS